MQICHATSEGRYYLEHCSLRTDLPEERVQVEKSKVFGIKSLYRKVAFLKDYSVCLYVPL